MEPSLVNFILEQLTAYGPPILGLALLIAAAGLPTPATPLIIAAGALARQEVVSPHGAAFLGLLGIVLGDTVSYGLGRFAGDRVQRRLSSRREALWQRAASYFQRFGPWAIVLTHFPLVSMDVPTNLIAGSSRYPFARFLLLVSSSRAVWLLCYGALGYAISSQWQSIYALIGRYTMWLGVLLAAGLVIGLLLRHFRQRRARPRDRSLV